MCFSFLTYGSHVLQMAEWQIARCHIHCKVFTDCCSTCQSPMLDKYTIEANGNQFFRISGIWQTCFALWQMADCQMWLPYARTEMHKTYLIV